MEPETSLGRILKDGKMKKPVKLKGIKALENTAVLCRYGNLMRL